MQVLRPGELLIGVNEARTQMRAAEQVAGWFAGKGWATRFVRVPEHFLHLDVLFTALDGARALCAVDVVDSADLAWLEQRLELIPRGYKDVVRMGRGAARCLTMPLRRALGESAMTQASAGAVKHGITIADRDLPNIDYGKGVYLYDRDGRQYIDGSSGPAVYSVGHGDEEVNEAISKQLPRVAHGYRYLFTSDPLEELTELIRTFCGADLSSMVSVCSGSEAVESALKLALQYLSARGEITRRHFISRRRSWHGNTPGAPSVSDFLERRRLNSSDLRSLWRTDDRR